MKTILRLVAITLAMGALQSCAQLVLSDDALERCLQNELKAESRFEACQKAAEEGHAKAQTNLGIMYRKGRGVSQDDNEAVSWYRRAAEQGDAVAQYNLGVMYEKGRSVSQDDNEAVSWYRRAAEQGDARAQYNLGVMYAKGRDVHQNFVLAHTWYSLAAASGHDTAADVQNQLGRLMTPAEVEEAQRLAREWVAAHPKY